MNQFTEPLLAESESLAKYSANINFTTTEMNLVRQMLALINVKLRNSNLKIATLRYHYHGELITIIPRPKKGPLTRVHYTSSEAIQYLGNILRSR